MPPSGSFTLKLTSKACWPISVLHCVLLFSDKSVFMSYITAAIILQEKYFEIRKKKSI